VKEKKWRKKEGGKGKKSDENKGVGECVFVTKTNKTKPTNKQNETERRITDVHQARNTNKN
jgi:hypothetical protein